MHTNISAFTKAKIMYERTPVVIKITSEIFPAKKKQIREITKNYLKFFTTFVALNNVVKNVVYYKCSFAPLAIQHSHKIKT